MVDTCSRAFHYSHAMGGMNMENRQKEEMKTTTKAVIYARVSTDPDKQEITNQLKPLKEYANALGCEITRVYTDYCSGASSSRPEFQQMLLDATHGRFNTVLVWSLDRFSREGIFQTMAYLKKLQKSNVTLKSLQEGWLDTSEMGELLLAIFSWVARQERLRLSERIKAGLKNPKNVKAKNVGKRGKDKHPRRKSGYLLRWQKEKKK